MTNDPIYDAFLKRQAEDGRALARESDILELTLLDECSFLARYRVESLFVDDGSIAEGALDVVVGIRFHRDYLRRADPFQVLTLLSPHHVFHPNIRPPFICLGSITPGTGLVDLLYRTFDLLTFHNVTPREDDALNPHACAWARQHRDRFPIDARPLKRLHR